MENIETTTQTVEQSADQQDAFLMGFGDDDTLDTEQSVDQQADDAEGSEHTEET